MKNVQKRIPVLERLAKEMQVLSEAEQRKFIGGDYWDDHGVWSMDSNGNLFWTRTSSGSGSYYDDSGYGNSGNNGSSGDYGSSGNYVDYGSSGYGSSGYGSSGYGSSGDGSSGDGTHVPDGMCTLGAIIKAIREFGKNPDTSKIDRDLLKYQVVTLNGVAYKMTPTELNSLLSEYFSTSPISSWADVSNAVSRGKPILATILSYGETGHSIMITSISGNDLTYWDPTEGKYITKNHKDLKLDPNTSFVLDPK